MGFPTWTLWGMAIAAGGALIFIALAYIAQTPALLKQFRLTRTRLASRARALTGFGLALLLVGIGIFAAGVPVDLAGTAPVGGAASVSSGESSMMADSGDSTLTDQQIADADADINAETGSQNGVQADAEPESGAFARPASSDDSQDESEQAESSAGFGVSDTVSESDSDDQIETAADNIIEVSTVDPNAVLDTETNVTFTPTPSPQPTLTPSLTPTPSVTPTPSSTPTSTPTPTATPSPTLTPTPILGDTATVDSVSSVIWVRRTPDGEQLELVLDGDTIILENGRANLAGELWQKVRTVNGTLGWMQADLLDYGE